MGFTQPDLPAGDPDEFLQKPLMERMRILAIDWADRGFGSPKLIHTIYLVKLVVFFAIGGVTVATATSGLYSASDFPRFVGGHSVTWTAPE